MGPRTTAIALSLVAMGTTSLSGYGNQSVFAKEKSGNYQTLLSKEKKFGSNDDLKQAKLLFSEGLHAGEKNTSKSIIK